MVNHSVILVHGFSNSPEDFRIWKKEIENQGLNAITIPWKKDDTVFESISAYAKKLHRIIYDNCSSDDEISLLGFSMGGLVVRYYFQTSPHIPLNLRRILTVSTPHYGTEWSSLATLGGNIGDMFSLALRQKPIFEKPVSKTTLAMMVPESPFLLRLNRLNQQNKGRYRTMRFVNYWLSRDLVVFPSTNAILPLDGVINHLFNSNMTHLDILEAKGTEKILLPFIIPELLDQSHTEKLGPQSREEHIKLRNERIQKKFRNFFPGL